MKRPAVQLTHIGKAVQDPGQFRVGADMALAVKDRLLRVQAAGQIQRRQFQAAAAEIRRVLPHGDGVLIHDAVDAVILILQLRKAAERADIVAQGQHTAGLDPGKNHRALFIRFH